MDLKLTEDSDEMSKRLTNANKKINEKLYDEDIFNGLTKRICDEPIVQTNNIVAGGPQRLKVSFPVIDQSKHRVIKIMITLDAIPDIAKGSLSLIEPNVACHAKESQ